MQGTSTSKGASKQQARAMLARRERCAQARAYLVRRLLAFLIASMLGCELLLTGDLNSCEILSVFVAEDVLAATCAGRAACMSVR